MLKAPWERPNLLSRVSFHWMTSYMRKNPLQLEDILPGIPVNEEREKARLKKKKRKKSRTKNDCLFTVAECHSFTDVSDRWGNTETFSSFLRVFKREILTSVVGACFVFALQFFIVMFLFNQLASFLSDATQTLWWGWTLICVMFVANLLQNFAFAIVWVRNIKVCFFFFALSGMMLLNLRMNFGFQLGILAKVGFSASVARKSIRLKIGDDGLVVNMLSSDAERLFEMGNFFIWMISAPLQVVTSCSLICYLLGVAGIPSFAIVILIVVVQRRNGGLVGQIRKSAFPFTDKRLNLIQELISAIKIVKIYCFESSVSESVLSARKDEISRLKRSSLVSSFTATLVQANGMLILLVCLTFYVGLFGTLSVSTAFTVLSLVNGLWFPMHMLGLGHLQLSLVLLHSVLKKYFSRACSRRGCNSIV